MKETYTESEVFSNITKLIAQHYEIEPDCVTPEFIEEERRKKIYPTTRYCMGSLNGGYSTIGLVFFTGNELNRIGEIVDELCWRTLK